MFGDHDMSEDHVELRRYLCVEVYLDKLQVVVRVLGIKPTNGVVLNVSRRCIKVRFEQDIPTPWVGYDCLVRSFEDPQALVNPEAKLGKLRRMEGEGEYAIEFDGPLEVLSMGNDPETVESGSGARSDDESNESHPPMPPDRNSAESATKQALRQRAARAERRGLNALESGRFDTAKECLLEAATTYEELGDIGSIFAVTHYLGVALAEQGETARAVRIWEEIIDRGCDSPATFNCLVRHYRSRGDDALVQRLYERLDQAANEKTGEFFRFPLEPAGLGPAVRDPDAAPGAGNRLRVLIADDEPAVHAVLERILVPLGYELLNAVNGKEALDTILTSSVDLILLDVFMPIHSGLDVLYRIRAEGIQTPVIVMSGVAGEQMVQDAKALAANYLTKPFDAKAVSDSVNRALASRHEESSAEP